jgi:hypothetical protein
MDEDIIPDPAVILVKSEPLEHEAEHHVLACAARVSAVHIFGSFSNQDLCRCTCMCICAHVQIIPA